MKRTAVPGTTYQVPDTLGNFSVRVSLAGIEPVGFRVKSDLRNHCAIVQPRLYDSAMFTQITLKTEGPHGLPSDHGPRRLIRQRRRSGYAWPGLVSFQPTTMPATLHTRETSRARTHDSMRGGWVRHGTTAPGQGLRIKRFGRTAFP